MKRSVAHLCIAIALAWSLTSTLQGQQLQEGTWSGTWVRARGRNPRPRSVSLEVKKTPDPHWRWRAAQGEVLTATFAGQEGRSQLSDIQLDKETLSYSYLAGDAKVNCRLNLRPDGAYEGECVGEGGSPRATLTLTPPEASTEPER